MPTTANASMKHWGLVPLRAAIGTVFLMHGGQKLFVFGLTGTADIMGKIGIPVPALAATVVIAVELVGGLSILAGLKTRWTSIGVRPVRGVAFAWPGATLFSAAQAVMQAPQPVQRSRSITMP